jgi:hypothetical protein
MRGDAFFRFARFEVVRAVPRAAFGLLLSGFLAVAPIDFFAGPSRFEGMTAPSFGAARQNEGT